MSRYATNPNYLIDEVTKVNERARDLVNEGWQVHFGVTDDGGRVFLHLKASRSCDPPAKEEEE